MQKKDRNIRDIPQVSKSKISPVLTGLAWLRAIACLSIIAYHLNQLRPTANLSEINWDIYQFTETLPIIVSFFFILTGALVSMRYWKSILLGMPTPSAKRMLIDRIIRIGPPYWAALAAWLWATAAIHNLPSDWLPRFISGAWFFSWIHPTTFFPVDMNGPLWYISYDIMGAILLLFIMCRVSQSPSLGKTLWTFLLASILLVLGHLIFIQLPFPAVSGIMSEWFPYYNPFIFGIHFLIWWIVGGLFVLTEKQNWSKGYVFDLAFLFVSFLLFSYLWRIREFWDFEYTILHSPYHFPVATVLIAACIYLITRTRILWITLDNSVFSFIAKISFSLYLWHGLVIAILRDTILLGYPLDFAKWCIFALVVYGTSFGIAWASYHLLEIRASWWIAKRIHGS